ECTIVPGLFCPPAMCSLHKRSYTHYTLSARGIPLMQQDSAGTRPTDTPVKRPLLVVLVLGFSSLCAAMMQSLVIPIQSDLPQLLDTSASNTSWVVTATLLGGAISMPVAGRLADIFGKKPVLIAMATSLLIGSLICATTDIFLLILAVRGLQGLSMGYIPAAISMAPE